jgi:hypothetical protein
VSHHHVPWVLATLNRLWNTAAIIVFYEIIKSHLRKRDEKKQNDRS